MKERKLTDFGLAVKTELLNIGKSQAWLEEQVKEKTGMYVDHGYMYRILTGKRTPERIIKAIRETLNMKDGGD